MTIFQILSVIPSVLVFYMMVCRLNAKKRGVLSLEGWGYLMFMGGSIFTMYPAITVGHLPPMDKLMLDFGLLLYFGQHTLRIAKWRNRL